MSAYASGEQPAVGDEVRFNEPWILWWLGGKDEMRVAEIVEWVSGRQFIVVKWLCSKCDSELSEIATRWNPQNFILRYRKPEGQKS